MTERSVTHATFTLERSYPASPARVYQAFTDPQARRRWFFHTDSWTLHAHSGGEVAVGAIESSRFSPPGSTAIITNDSSYMDIVPDERLVFAYQMTIDGKRISASLSTVEFRPEGEGTRLRFTEQDAFLDGYDGAADREEGTRAMLDELGRELERG